MKSKLCLLAVDANDSELEAAAEQYREEHVQWFIKHAGFNTTVVEKFKTEGIAGPDLLEAIKSDKDLEDLGITSPLEQLKLCILFQRHVLRKELKYPVSLSKAIQFAESCGLPKETVKQMVHHEVDGEYLMRATPAVFNELGIPPKDHMMIKMLFPIWVSTKQFDHRDEDLVIQFLRTSPNLEKHVERFQELHIHKEILLRANPEILKALGVRSAVERLQISVFPRWLASQQPKYSSDALQTFMRKTKPFDQYVENFQKFNIDVDMILETDDNERKLVLDELGITAKRQQTQFCRKLREEFL